MRRWGILLVGVVVSSARVPRLLGSGDDCDLLPDCCGDTDRELEPDDDADPSLPLDCEPTSDAAVFCP